MPRSKAQQWQLDGTGISSHDFSISSSAAQCLLIWSAHWCREHGFSKLTILSVTEACRESESVSVLAIS